MVERKRLRSGDDSPNLNYQLKILQHCSDMHADKIAYELDSFREEYGPAPSCEIRTITTKKKRHTSQLIDSVIMNLKLSDDQLASVSSRSNDSRNGCNAWW